MFQKDAQNYINCNTEKDDRLLLVVLPYAYIGELDWVSLYSSKLRSGTVNMESEPVVN